MIHVRSISIQVMFICGPFYSNSYGLAKNYKALRFKELKASLAMLVKLYSVIIVTHNTTDCGF